MVEIFTNKDDVIKFFQGKDLNEYSLGVDQYGRDVVKKNTWLNTSWLGRKIDHMLGYDFSDSPKKLEFIKENINLFAQPVLRKSTEQFNSETASEIFKEKVITRGENPSTRSAEQFRQVQQQEAPSFQKLQGKDIEPKLTEHLIDPIEIWESLMGGPEQVENLSTAQQKTEKLNDHIAAVGFLMRLKINPNYSGKFSDVNRVVAMLREKAAAGAVLSEEKLEFIKKFDSIRDEFVKEIIKKQETIEKAKEEEDAKIELDINPIVDKATSQLNELQAYLDAVKTQIKRKE